MKSGDEVSYDHYISREPRFVANIHRYILKREYANCRIIIVDHTSNYTFHFGQTSTKGSQMVEAKHKFERFTEYYRVG